MCKEQTDKRKEYLSNELFFSSDEFCEHPQKIAFFNSKQKPYGKYDCYRCNGTGIYQWMTTMGAMGGACYKCWGTGKHSGRLYLRKEIKWQQSSKEKRNAKRTEYYALLEETNALKRIAYNHSEKGLAYRNKRLSWKRDKVADKHKSNFVGTLKQREDFTLTLTFRKGFDTNFGVSFLNTLKDAQGNVFTYWGASLLDVEVNDTVTVKATVEEHKEYQGVNQTVIKRPKIITKGENK